MKLSAPIYVLKSQAKQLKILKSISLAQALNEIVHREGFSSWSLLQSKANEIIPQRRDDILEYLNPGDLVLLGSRPGLGKTKLAIRLLLQAAHLGRPSAVFTLEESRQKIAARIADIDEEVGENHPLLLFDFSDDISADYIIKRTTGNISSGSVIMIDYLQILDQKRDKPELHTQIEALKEFAKETGCILVFTSQLDRRLSGAWHTMTSPLTTILLPGLSSVNAKEEIGRISVAIAAIIFVI